MRISERFNLGVNQTELAFVDVDTERDVELFIDPCWVHIGEDQWSRGASNTLYGFFEHVVNLYQSGNREEARSLFNSAHEPNETCLGMSRNRPDGTGASEEMLLNVFDSITSDEMIQQGIIRRLEDLHVFIDGFGQDRLSDLVTNIIRQHLMDFTREQCQLHDIPLGDEEVRIGMYWDNEMKTWREVFERPLIVDGRIILLVPKRIVVKSYKYNASQYCTHHVLAHRQEEHLQENTSLVRRIERRNGDVEIKVYKKDVRRVEVQEAGKAEKEYIREVTVENPDLIEVFRQSIANVLLNPATTNRLTDQEFMDMVAKPQGNSR